MQVWNCWDEKVLEKVFKRPPGTSIDTVVREYAAKLNSRIMKRS